MGKLYRLYIDESGDNSYGRKKIKEVPMPMINNKSVVRPIDKKRRPSRTPSCIIEVPVYPDLNKDEVRYFGLTGCIIDLDEHDNIFSQKFEELKKKHFLYDANRTVIFHRKEIDKCIGSFKCLKDSQKKELFEKDFLEFLKEMNYTLITVVTDKKRNGELSEFYEYCALPKSS